MRTPIRTNLIIICTVLITLMVVVCGGRVLGFLLGFSSYPSNEDLAQRYLDAIQRQDIEQAVGLASPSCAASIRAEAHTAIEKYGGAEIQNINLQVRSGGGSDDEIRFVTLTFEYRREGLTAWQQDHLILITDYDPPGFRYIACGG